MKTSSLLIQRMPGENFLVRFAMERIHQLESEVARLKNNYEGAEKYLRIIQGQRLLSVPVKDVRYIKAESNYSRVFLKSGEQYYTSKTLKTWVGELSPLDFLRCHRTFLVNKTEISEVNRKANQIILQNGEVIPTSRRYQKSFVHSMFTDAFKSEISSSRKTDAAVHKLIPLEATLTR